MIGNKSADKTTKVSRTSPQNILETVESEIEKFFDRKTVFDRKIPKERYISPDESQTIIDDIILI